MYFLTHKKRLTIYRNKKTGLLEVVGDVGPMSVKRLLSEALASVDAKLPKPAQLSGLKPISEAQEAIVHRVKARLMGTGKISTRDCWRLGTADGRKIFTLLRRQGMLKPAHDETGFYWEKNSSGKGRHKVHLWTGVKG